MKNLLRRLPVQRSQNIVCLVCPGGDKAVVLHLMIDILLIGFHPAALVLDQRISHGVLVHSSVSRHLAAIAGPAHQRDIPTLQYRINRRQYTGIVAGAEINTDRVVLGSLDAVHIFFQTLDVPYWHHRNLLQYVRRRRNSFRKCNHTYPFLHDLRIVTHSYTSDTGNSRIEFFQFFYMFFELLTVREQHKKLRPADAANRFLQISTLAFSKNLFHYVVPLFARCNFI